MTSSSPGGKNPAGKFKSHTYISQISSHMYDFSKIGQRVKIAMANTRSAIILLLGNKIKGTSTHG